MSGAQPAHRRRLRTAVAVLATLGSLVVASGAGVEAVRRHEATRRHPAPGRLVDVGGRRLQLDCRGAGSPTVVLESGLDHLGALSWAAVHDALARTTRTCAYSRAGMLWSDPAPGPFDGVRAARDLHAALTTAGERAPWVLVGHSLGGPYALLFTRRYDAEVRGVVLVDPSHPAQVARLEQATGRAMAMPTGLLTVGTALAWTGIVRLASEGDAPARWPAAAVSIAGAYLPRSVGALLREARARDATLAAADDARRLGARPLVVLTAGAPPDAAALARVGLTPEQGRQQQAAWRALHDDVATWSRASRHEVVPDASHYLQFDRPDVVIRAVRDVVARVRAGGPAPDNQRGARRRATIASGQPLRSIVSRPRDVP